MSGKSKHGRRKLPRSRRKKEQHVVPAPGIQQPAATPVNKPAPPGVSTPQAGAPVAAVPVAASKYPYLAGELRRIGILAGAIIVILIILTFVFS